MPLSKSTDQGKGGADMFARCIANGALPPQESALISGQLNSHKGRSRAVSSTGRRWQLHSKELIIERHLFIDIDLPSAAALDQLLALLAEQFARLPIGQAGETIFQRQFATFLCGWFHLNEMLIKRVKTIQNIL